MSDLHRDVDRAARDQSEADGRLNEAPDLAGQRRDVGARASFDAYLQGLRDDKAPAQGGAKGPAGGGEKADGAKAGGPKAAGAKAGAQGEHQTEKEGEGGGAKGERGALPEAAGKGEAVASPAGAQGQVQKGAAQPKSAGVGGGGPTTKAGGGATAWPTVQAAAPKAPAVPALQTVPTAETTTLPSVPGSAPGAVAAAATQVRGAAEGQQALVDAEAANQVAQIQAAGAQQQQAAAAAVEALRAEVAASFAQLRQSIQARGDETKMGLAAARDTEKGRVREAADAQIARMRDGVTQRHDAMLAMGDTLAADAVAHGQAEGNRVQAAGAENAAMAEAIGQAKANQFKGADEAAAIAGMAHQTAGEAAQRFTDQSLEAAGQAIAEGELLGEKLQADAAEFAANFAVDEDAVAAVEQAAQEAEAAIDARYAEVETTVDDAVAQALAGADEGELAAQTQLDAQAQGFAPVIDQTVQAACAAVQQGAEASKAAIVEHVGGLLDAAGRAHADNDVRAAEALLAAEADVLAAGAAAVEAVGESGLQARAGLEQAGADTVEGIAQSGQPILEQNQAVEQSFADQMAQVHEGVAGAMTEIADGAVAQITTTADDFEGKQDEAFAEGQGKLEGTLTEGKTEITGRVDTVLTSMDQALAELGPAITGKADEIEHATFWDKVTSAVGAFFSGFFGQAWNFLKGLGMVLLILAAAVVVALVLALVLAVLAPQLLIGIIAFLAVYGGTLLTVLAWIGVAAAVALAAYGIYKAWVAWNDPNVPWEGKWEATGRALFDVVDAIGPTKLLKPFQGLWRSTKAVDAMADAGRLDDLADLAKLENVRDAARGGDAVADAARHADDAAALTRRTEDVAGAAARADDVVPPNRWADPDLSTDEVYALYRQNTKSPSLTREAVQAKMGEGLRYDPRSGRWKQVGGRLDEIAKAKAAPKGPSGRRWDDPDLSKAEFVQDYRARQPNTKLTDAELAAKYDQGMRLNPETGRLRKPQWSNDEIRNWYLKENGTIEALDQKWLAEGLGAEERARRAYEIRHGARVKARSMMQDKRAVADLQARDVKKYGNPDGPTFEQLVEKARKAGKQGDAPYDEIVGSSQRTDKATNERFGLQGKDSRSGDAAPVKGTKPTAEQPATGRPLDEEVAPRAEDAPRHDGRGSAVPHEMGEAVETAAHVVHVEHAAHAAEKLAKAARAGKAETAAQRLLGTPKPNSVPTEQAEEVKEEDAEQARKRDERDEDVDPMAPAPTARPH